MQKLITKEILKKTPALYKTEKIKTRDKIATARFFNPCGIGTWYLVEYDPETKGAFGLCHLHEWELGYFSLDELESLKLPYGLKIERDILFEPRPLGTCGDAAEYFQRRFENYP